MRQERLLSVGTDGGGYINLLCTNKDDLSRSGLIRGNVFDWEMKVIYWYRLSDSTPRQRSIWRKGTATPKKEKEKKDEAAKTCQRRSGTRGAARGRRRGCRTALISSASDPEDRPYPIGRLSPLRASATSRRTRLAAAAGQSGQYRRPWSGGTKQCAIPRAGADPNV